GSFSTRSATRRAVLRLASAVLPKSAMQSFLSLNPLGQVPQLAAQRRVHQAFRWLHLHDGLLMDWQRTLVGIPAPPFGEASRAAWLLEQVRALGLQHTGR